MRRWAPALVLAQITSPQIGAAVVTRLFGHIGTWATVSLRVLFAALVLAVLPGRRLRAIISGLALLAIHSGAPPAGLVFAGVAATCRAGYVLLARSLGRRFPDRAGLVAGFWTGRCSRWLSRSACSPRRSPTALTWPRCATSIRTPSILLSLSPVIGLAVGYVGLGQVPAGRQFAGMALITISSTGAVRTREAVAPSRDEGEGREAV